MFRNILSIIGRILVILLAAGVISVGIYAISQSSAGAAGAAGLGGGPNGGRGGPPSGLQQNAPSFAQGQNTQGQDTLPAGFDPAQQGQGRSGREGGGESFSLERGLPDLAHDLAVIAVLVGLVSLLRFMTRLFRRRAKLSV